MNEVHVISQAVPRKPSLSNSEILSTRCLYNLAMGRAISVLRLALALSGHELTALSGVHYFRLKQIERGELSPTLNELHTLARVFNIELKEIVLLAEELARRWRM